MLKVTTVLGIPTPRASFKVAVTVAGEPLEMELLLRVTNILGAAVGVTEKFFDADAAVVPT